MSTPHDPIIHSKPAFGWAAMNDRGDIYVASVRRSRREVFDFLPEFSISARDYERLSPAARVRKARANGWRVIRVKITEAGRG